MRLQSNLPQALVLRGRHSCSLKGGRDLARQVIAIQLARRGLAAQLHHSMVIAHLQTESKKRPPNYFKIVSLGYRRPMKGTASASASKIKGRRHTRSQNKATYLGRLSFVADPLNLEGRWLGAPGDCVSAHSLNTWCSTFCQPICKRIWMNKK